MSDNQNLLAMLEGLSPTDLQKLLAAAMEKKKAVDEQLTESKKAYLTELVGKLEGIIPPEACTVSFGIDENGHISERSYRSGIKVKSAGTGSGVSTGKGTIVNDEMPVGATAFRTYKGEQHELVRREERVYVLDGNRECRSYTEAAKLVQGSDTAVNGRKFWLVDGKVVE
jgi:hypothetical protein